MPRIPLSAQQRLRRSWDAARAEPTGLSGR
nr:MAG TPA: hypothetical protein [Caudoviricetes sp.]